MEGIPGVDGQSYDGPCPLRDPDSCWVGKGQERGCGQENEPLLDCKELKPLELQLILDNFKIGILSEPELTSCDG